MGKTNQSRLFRFNFYSVVPCRNYSTDIDGLTKQQKQQVEKAEMTQTVDTKVASKKLKQEQVSGNSMDVMNMREKVNHKSMMETIFCQDTSLCMTSQGVMHSVVP